PATGATSIASGALKFTPGASGAIFPNGAFSFQVKDNGGTLNFGQDTSAIAYDITFNTPTVVVNHAPSGASSTVGVAAGGNYTIQANDFHFSDDPLDIPANNLRNVQITQLSLGGGSLTNGGTPITTPTTISVSDIVNGKLLFTAPSTTANVFFAFKVQDDGGVAPDTDPTARTLT